VVIHPDTAAMRITISLSNLTALFGHERTETTPQYTLCAARSEAKCNFCVACGRPATACATNHVVRTSPFRTGLRKRSQSAPNPMMKRGLLALSRCAQLSAPGECSARELHLSPVPCLGGWLEESENASGLTPPNPRGECRSESSGPSRAKERAAYSETR
jgi:hypothetical protein